MIYRLENVRHCFGRHVALDVPDLQIPSGCILGIVGPNGAGKTTLLRILALLDRPSEGKLYMDGDLADASPGGMQRLRRRTTLVLQEHFLFATTVARNVSYGLRKRGVSHGAISSRTSQVLEIVGLSDKAHQNARTLSGGEGKRLAIARALAVNPDVLLLDEPMANIDKRSEESIQQIISRVNREKSVTVIMTAHDLPMAYRTCDEVISIVNGRVIETPVDNLFTGEVVELDGSSCMEVAPDVRIALHTKVRDRVIIAVHPKNIIISQVPLESSARNCFCGTISKVIADGDSVRISVNVVSNHTSLSASATGKQSEALAHGVEFVSLVTKASYEKLHLDPGRQVYITFKATSVDIY